MKDDPKLNYKGVECDSEEEYYFLTWVYELIKLGYIHKVERADTFNLTPKYAYELVEEIQLKTKVKKVVKNKVILNPHVYTPDFIIYWKDKKFIEHGIYEDLCKINPQFTIYEKDGFPITYVEIKPDFDQNNMTRIFKINQKFTYFIYSIYVILVNVPGSLFQDTFTPLSYFYTLKTGKKRKIKWKPITVEEYINNKIKNNVSK